MPKHVRIVAHLTIDDLAYPYRKATGSIERSHFQIIWLMAQGKRVSQVAESTGYCANWIRMLGRHYNQDGLRALADQRKHNNGALFHRSFLARSYAKQAGMLFMSDASQVEI